MRAREQSLDESTGGRRHLLPRKLITYTNYDGGDKDDGDGDDLNDQQEVIHHSQILGNRMMIMVNKVSTLKTTI